MYDIHMQSRQIRCMQASSRVADSLQDAEVANLLFDYRARLSRVDLTMGHRPRTQKPPQCPPFWTLDFPDPAAYTFRICPLQALQALPVPGPALSGQGPQLKQLEGLDGFIVL